MIKADKKVKVYLLEKMSATIIAPTTGRRYEIEKKDDKEVYTRIRFEHLEDALLTHGGRKLYEKYLLIKDKDVVEELGLVDKTKKDEATMKDALLDMSEFEFDQFLDEMNEEDYLDLAKLAVDIGLNDLNKIKKIKLETNYDILPSILNEDVKFEPKKQAKDNKSKEDEKSLDFNFDDLKKTELKEVAKEMDINVGNSLKATIIDKLKKEDKETAKQLAERYIK